MNQQYVRIRECRPISGFNKTFLEQNLQSEVNLQAKLLICDPIFSKLPKDANRKNCDLNYMQQDTSASFIQKFDPEVVLLLFPLCFFRTQNGKVLMGVYGGVFSHHIHVEHCELNSCYLTWISKQVTGNEIYTRQYCLWVDREKCSKNREKNLMPCLPLLIFQSVSQCFRQFCCIYIVDLKSLGIHICIYALRAFSHITPHDISNSIYIWRSEAADGKLEMQ